MRAARIQHENELKTATALEAQHVELGRKWQRRDASDIVAAYAPDAVLLVPGGLPVRGRSAIRLFIGAVLDEPSFTLAWSVDQVRIASSNDLATVAGRYVQHIPDGEGYVVETGHYVATYERRKGAWLISTEINTPGPIERRKGLPNSDFKPIRRHSDAVRP